MPEIPKQLKWYVPLGLGSVNGPPVWRVSADHRTGCVEIKRAPLLKFFSVMMGLFFGVLIVGALFAIRTYLPLDKEGETVVAFAMIFFPPFMLFAFVALDALVTVMNSQHWNGPLRFRFDPQNGEMFFPRENVTYRQGNYSKLILGCVRGADMKGAFKTFGVWMKQKKDGTLAQTTQIFMLVLDDNNEWKRYHLADDWVPWPTGESGSKQFMNLTTKLRQFLLFDEFVKDYSMDECYEQQRDSVGTNQVLW